MEQYSTINWNEKDTDEVYDFLYNELEEAEQYPFFSWLMEHFPDVEIDWLEIFEDFSDELFYSGRVDLVISFVEWYKQNNLDDYQERFEFIERDLCNYFLYKNDIEKLQERIPFITQNPIIALDILTERLQYQLIYYGYYEMALSYAEAVWIPVDESEDLKGFAAYPFVNTIYVSELQKYYTDWLNNIHFDEDQLFCEMANLGFDDDIDSFNRILNLLKGELNLADIKDSIQNGKDNHMLILNIHFLKHMMHTYQLPFVFSEWMWNFIATTEIFGKHKGIENWFYVDAKTFEQHINNKLDRFFGFNELEIFGKVWGLNFVFGFLNQHKLLSDEHYEKMRENFLYFRNKMMLNVGKNLWQMNFVFNWPSTNNYIVDPSEQTLFNETYGITEIEAVEKINNYLSVNGIPDRIKNELKLKNLYSDNRLPFWSENTPYLKLEPDTGRNDLCPCGSGKKYKKCCLSN